MVRVVCGSAEGEPLTRGSAAPVALRVVFRVGPQRRSQWARHDAQVDFFGSANLRSRLVASRWNSSVQGVTSPPPGSLPDCGEEEPPEAAELPLERLGSKDGALFFAMPAILVKESKRTGRTLVPLSLRERLGEGAPYW